MGGGGGGRREKCGPPWERGGLGGDLGPLLAACTPEQGGGRRGECGCRGSELGLAELGSWHHCLSTSLAVVHPVPTGPQNSVRWPWEQSQMPASLSRKQGLSSIWWDLTVSCTPASDPLPACLSGSWEGCSVGAGLWPNLCRDPQRETARALPSPTVSQRPQRQPLGFLALVGWQGSERACGFTTSL